MTYIVLTLTHYTTLELERNNDNNNNTISKLYLLFEIFEQVNKEQMVPFIAIY